MRLPSWLLWLILLLIPFAFFTNLGVQPFIDDEGNRSLVALEMLWQGNFVTPTLHGDYYYNKPPLWNWLLALSFTLWGNVSEWSARFPSVLALLGFSASVFYTYRKDLGKERALLVAFAVLTCGRIIFWESLLALIDICFSWSVFGLFIVIYRKGEQRAWWSMFLLSYLLMVIGFMFKGLPAIVFQGLTIITYLLMKKEWKRLFSLEHIVSGLLSVGLLAIYYATYHRYNKLENIFEALFVESGKRTAVAYSIGDTLQHVLNFPLELFYHFIPWTFLAFFFFNKKSRERLNMVPIVHYGVLVFIANVAIYWLSPNFYPRYILMLLPLGFAALVQLIPEEESPHWTHRLVRGLLGLFIGVAIAGTLATLFVEDTQVVEALWVKAIIVAIGLGALGVLYWRQKEKQYFVFVAALVLFRLGFSLLVLPPRAVVDQGQYIKKEAITFGERWQGRTLYVFKETHMEPAVSFYIERAKGEIVERSLTDLSTEDYYIFSPLQYAPDLFGPAIDSFAVRHAKCSHYYISQLTTTAIEEIEAKTIGDRPTF